MAQTPKDMVPDETREPFFVEEPKIEAIDPFKYINCTNYLDLNTISILLKEIEKNILAYTHTDIAQALSVAGISYEQFQKIPCFVYINYFSNLAIKRLDLLEIIIYTYITIWECNDMKIFIDNNFAFFLYVVDKYLDFQTIQQCSFYNLKGRSNIKDDVKTNKQMINILYEDLITCYPYKSTANLILHLLNDDTTYNFSNVDFRFLDDHLHIAHLALHFSATNVFNQFAQGIKDKNFNNYVKLYNGSYFDFDLLNDGTVPKWILAGSNCVNANMLPFLISTHDYIGFLKQNNLNERRIQGQVLLNCAKYNEFLIFRTFLNKDTAKSCIKHITTASGLEAFYLETMYKMLDINFLNKLYDTESSNYIGLYSRLLFFECNSKIPYKIKNFELTVNKNKLLNPFQVYEFLSYLPSFLEIKNASVKDPKTDLFRYRIVYNFKYIKESLITSTNKKTLFDIVLVKGNLFSIQLKNLPEGMMIDEDSYLKIHKSILPSPQTKNKFRTKLIKYNIIDRPETEDERDIYDELKTLPGRVRVHYCDDNETYQMFCQGHRVEWVSWVSPISAQLLMNPNCKIQLIEVDATFPIVDYILIVPQIVIYNTGIPMGFYVGPSENAEAYKLFFASLEKSGVTIERIREIPFLGDLGTGIKKFAKDKELIIWACIRHVLNLLSEGSMVDGMIEDTIRAIRQEDYEAKAIQYTQLLEEWHNEGAISSNAIQKYNKFCINKKGKFCLCFRECLIGPSNHAESFHLQYQKILEKFSAGKFDFKLMIHLLSDYIMQREKDVPKIVNTNVSRELSNQKKYAKQLLNVHPTCGQWCIDQELILKSKFGVKFPCIHEIKKDTTISQLTLPPCIGLFEIERNEAQNQFKVSNKSMTEIRMSQ